MKPQKYGMTRRELAAVMAAISPLAAQSPKSTDELEAAREEAKRNSAALRKFGTSALIEPSFVFRP
jgi:hypothetical protein